jgi:pantoate--beta-alanine ligase
LGEAAQAIADGGGVAEAIEKARARLEAAGFESVDYVELRDAETLLPVAGLDRPARLLAAARIGRTRLIDNLPVNPPDIS